MGADLTSCGTRNNSESLNGGQKQSAASTKPNSHDYARKLQKLAEWLLSRPEFELSSSTWGTPHAFFYFYDKEQFIAAAKALGSGKKEFTEDTIAFLAAAPVCTVKIGIDRNKVCRLVRPAKYECDPFFSEEELSEIGGAQ